MSTAPLQCETLLCDISYKTKLFPFLFLNLDKSLKIELQEKSIKKHAIWASCS